MNIVTFTSITGGKDNLIEKQNTVGADFFAFVGEPKESKTWKQIQVYDKFNSDRRNSRVVKLIPHKYFDCEYSIWLDGNLSLLVPAKELIEKYLNGYDIAVFKHPIRNCIYKEAIECAKRGLDDPEVIIEQVKAYEDEGFPKEYGLGENMMILRRHTKKIEQFNNAWFVEYARYSTRDQLSFMYVADKVGLPVNFIDEQFIEKDGRWIRGGIIEIVPHLTEQVIGN